MVGKTNLTFISKGEASSVQLIQKSYVTGATGKIYKMEVINDKIFVYADGCYVLTGPDFSDLNYIKRGNEKLKATHIVYADETYYTMDTTVDGRRTEHKIYATTDFQNYEEIDLENKCMMEERLVNATRLTGMFLDSRGNIIVTYSVDAGYSDFYYFYIYVIKSLKESLEAEIIEGRITETRSIYASDSFLMDDKIYLAKGWYSLDGVYTSAEYIRRYNYADGYFFFPERENGNGPAVLYRSRDGRSKIRYKHEIPAYFFGSIPYIIPINGKIGYLYIDKEGNPCLNIAEDVLGVGYIENQTIQLCEPIEEIYSVVEFDEKTYLGTYYGLIYELQLDYEGTIQRPDVTVIKTLAAKQALAQSVKYTDDRIKELKNYIDEKIGETVSAEESSTEVEA